MQIIKFIILLFIFLSSMGIGNILAKRYSSRVLELKEFKNALNVLKTKIKFTYEPIPEIFMQLERTIDSKIAGIFGQASRNLETMSTNEAWTKAVQENTLHLNNEDIGILKNLGKLLRQNRCRRTSK